MTPTSPPRPGTPTQPGIKLERATFPALPLTPEPLWTRQEAALIASLSATLIADFAASPWWGVSVALLGTVTLLTTVWSGLVLVGRATHGHFLKEWGFRASIFALAWLFIAAKWWVVVGLGRTDPGRFVGSMRGYDVALLIVLPLGILAGRGRLPRLLSLVADHPARLMAASFGSLGVLGALLLSLPISLQRVSELSFIDNLFMAFSAVCVTGLAVNTLTDTYTLFGQLVICLLVQIGGLSIMVLSAAIGMLAGRRMRVRSSVVFAGIVDSESLSGLRRQALGIVTATLMLELIGGVLLYSRFLTYEEIRTAQGHPLSGAQSPEWAAIFHAVNAFCNAGFSNFGNGLAPLIHDEVVIGVVAILILLGGIGFPVIGELWPRFGRFLLRQRRERVSLNTRVCLNTTAALFMGMCLAYLALEWSASFRDLHPGSRLMAAIFQSAASRTAGFSVVDIGAMRPATLMLTCVAMFVGACPGSCAGGIKTTTFAVLFASMRAELRGRPAQLFDRMLTEATLRKAVGVVFTSFAIVSLGVFLLLLIEPHEPLDVAVEVFSAFSTTGLSTGITPSLSIPGKLLIALLMYVGRIGPLTLALAFAARVEPTALRLPSERVQIG